MGPLRNLVVFDLLLGLQLLALVALLGRQPLLLLQLLALERGVGAGG